ncbi:hypothetical protein PR048_020594 [Dryococelus australis]|uniref:Uncharacterized protein n=1 Tax=Dryococelus australis TaxID=614101 RepID=A0ABQ9H6T2_9NEOP|nr:hypothetical protein PR048_020594 [Dryococelus australis]
MLKKKIILPLTIRLLTKNEFIKGSDQIAPAVHHRLTNTNMDTTTTVRLFSDACGGQNKNKTAVMMRHSFIPPERIFWHLEREFYSDSVVETPDEYVKVIKKRGNVTHLGEVCPVKDWKTYSDLDSEKDEGTF